MSRHLKEVIEMSKVITRVFAASFVYKKTDFVIIVLRSRLMGVWLETSKRVVFIRTKHAQPYTRGFRV